MHLGAAAPIVHLKIIYIMKNSKFQSKANPAVRKQYIYSMSKKELICYGRYLRFCAHVSQSANQKSMYQNLLKHARIRFKNLYF